jgi:oxygen-independent coproporphyrinogen-3 oxidase
LAGIYIHIPFCRQHCHYCNFHFVTSLREKDSLLHAINEEIVSRRDYVGHEVVDTIYFGGGTPSLLTAEELTTIIQTCSSAFNVSSMAEITLEANPDDITADILQSWKAARINRLSIGVQSFFVEDLAWMNRAHNAIQAREAVELAMKWFDNITIDLIYGTPSLTDERWKENVMTAVSLHVPHLSCYALTVEAKTPLAKMIKEKKTQDVDSDRQSDQFLLLMQWLSEAGYEHYEISNFAKPGFRSRHNAAYWRTAPGRAVKYIGIGPSAHSYNGSERQWNISNNAAYVRAINAGEPAFEKEILSAEQEVNEYIMTSLRTIEGLQLDLLDAASREKVLKASKKYIQSGHISSEENTIKLTREGKLLADGIASDLFI